MAGYAVEIRTVGPDEPAADAGTLTVPHHLTERARLRIDTFSGGHLLNLAVAGCLFNDILREAAKRKITITDLRVAADGSFRGNPLVCTEIDYEVEVAGDATDAELRRLVVDCERDSTIAHTLRKGTRVEARTVHVHGTS